MKEQKPSNLPPGVHEFLETYTLMREIQNKRCDPDCPFFDDDPFCVFRCPLENGAYTTRN